MKRRELRPVLLVSLFMGPSALGEGPMIRQRQ